MIVQEIKVHIYSLRVAEAEAERKTLKLSFKHLFNETQIIFHQIPTCLNDRVVIY